MLSGSGRSPLAAQRKVGDVDALLAENRSDAPDDAGHVKVAANDQGPLKRRFNIDAVESQQPRLLPMNDGSARAAVALRRVQHQRKNRCRAAAMALFLLLMHANAALSGNRRRVNAVHILRSLQQPGDGRITHQFGLGLSERAAVNDVNRVNAGITRALSRLRKKRSQPPGEVDKWSELHILLAAQRRHIHSILHDTRLEILANLMRNLDAN